MCICVCVRIRASTCTHACWKENFEEGNRFKFQVSKDLFKWQQGKKILKKWWKISQQDLFRKPSNFRWFNLCNVISTAFEICGRPHCYLHSQYSESNAPLGLWKDRSFQKSLVIAHSLLKNSDRESSSFSLSNTGMWSEPGTGRGKMSIQEASIDQLAILLHEHKSSWGFEPLLSCVQSGKRSLHSSELSPGQALLWPLIGCLHP